MVRAAILIPQCVSGPYRSDGRDQGDIRPQGALVSTLHSHIYVSVAHIIACGRIRRSAPTLGMELRWVWTIDRGRALCPSAGTSPRPSDERRDGG